MTKNLPALHVPQNEQTVQSAQSGDFDMATLTQIATAYLSNPNTKIAVEDIQNVLMTIRNSLTTVSAISEPTPALETRSPAVSIKKSVTPEYIICLEDGKRFKSLKRHLRTSYNISPEEYRARWNLPFDYPMTAPAYSERRSALAKSLGLGRKVGTVKAKAKRPTGRKVAKTTETTAA